VNDSIEIRQGFGVAEHPGRKRSAVEMTAGGHDLRTEPLNDVGKHLLTRQLQFTHDHVGVNDDRAVRGKLQRHRRFPCADSARESDEDHLVTPPFPN